MKSLLAALALTGALLVATPSHAAIMQFYCTSESVAEILAERSSNEPEAKVNISAIPFVQIGICRVLPHPATVEINKTGKVYMGPVATTQVVGFLDPSGTIQCFGVMPKDDVDAENRAKSL